MENRVVTLDIRPVPVPDKHPTIFRTFDALDQGATLLLINDHDPKPLYYQFAAERADQFHWNYVEQGPEVWKVEIGKRGGAAVSHGCCGHRQAERPTEVLCDEHRVIERVLAILEKLTRTPVDQSLDRWRKALDFIRHFADRCHHLKEEKILFPAMEAHGIPNEGGPIGVMLMEHEEGRSYVRSMAAALTLVESGNEAAKDALLSGARAYVRLLKEHIQKEDEILFPMADEAIPPDEQQKLLRTFEEHEVKEMGSGVHEKYLNIAEELERQS